MVGQDDPNFPNQVFFLGLTQMEQYVFMSSLSFFAEGFMATSMDSAHGHWRMNALWTWWLSWLVGVNCRENFL